MKRMNSGYLDWHESDSLLPAIPRRKSKSILSMALLWIFMAGVAKACLICEVILTMVLSISAGWANGWPGLSSQMVLSTVVTVWYALFFMTAAAGAGTIAGLIGALAGVRPKLQLRIYCLWLCFAAVAILCLSVVKFRSVYVMSGDLPSGR